METSAAAQIFAALGHPGRLAVWRLLLRRLPSGGQPGEMAAALGLKPNTLSHHLADLEAAGLIRVEARGRGRVYAAELGLAAALGDYLLNDCGQGREALRPAPAHAISPPPYRVLFLCTANAARSLMAESLLNHLGQGRFRAFSAGRQPATPDPQAMALLARRGHDTGLLRSKPVTEFQVGNAVPFDFVFTLCDRAAAEECPPWPGRPITAHWGMPDPAKVAGDTERMFAYSEALATLTRRIEAFAALSPAALDRLTLQHDIDSIARL